MADDIEIDTGDLERRMEGAMNSLKTEFASLRTGRASASMLEPVQVDAYGQMTPINQVGTVNVPEPRMVTINVWDKGLVGKVEKAIRESGLGINPQLNGTIIMLPIPELNEERRKELTKVASQYAEHARVAVRNVRRDGMDKIKRAKADGMSEDDQKFWETEVQDLTDRFISLSTMRWSTNKPRSCRFDDEGCCHGEDQARRRGAAPCGDHHGWQWPVGAKARASTPVRASCRGAAGARDRGILPRAGGRLSDNLCVFDRELEAHADRGRWSDEPFSPLHHQGNAGLRARERAGALYR